VSERVVLPDVALKPRTRGVNPSAKAQRGALILRPGLKAKLLTSIAKLRIGVSNDPDADYGPVVTPEHKARIEQWITTAEEEGAEIVVDGRGFTLQGHEKGFFVGPTLIDHVTPQMTSYQEEIFGPVMTLAPVSGLEEAIARVNASRFGLQCGVFTDSLREAEAAFQGLEVGGVVIGDYPTLRFDAMPYGGAKRSGFGREGVRYAFEEMTELKAMVTRAI